MTGRYYVEAADWLRDAGLVVVEVDGWQTRARSSGGFPEPGALGVQWHHTASRATPESDAAFMFFNAQDRPVGNMLLARDGVVWLGAAGAANTAGKGGPLTLSRGVLPVDGANARTWAIEAANDGVGEPWPAVQIDAFFAASNALNAAFGNEAGDVFNHNTWAPGRKIDPAVAAAVGGPWRPSSSTTSGTWAQADVTAETVARAASTPTPPTPPTPTPPPLEVPDMLFMGRLDTNPDLLLVGNGIAAQRVRSAMQTTFDAQMAAGLSRWHHPHRAGWPLITSLAQVAPFNAAQLRALVGIELDESLDDAAAG